MILYKKRTTKVLTRQSRSAGWSVPLVFANLRRQVFWHWGPYNRYVLLIMTLMGTTCNPSTTWSRLGFYTSFFGHLYQSYDPWFTPEFCFRSISLEQIDQFSLNFIYAFILIRSSFGLLHVIFRTFVQELWPLIMPKFCIHSISWEQIDWFSPNFINMHLYW